MDAPCHISQPSSVNIHKSWRSRLRLFLNNYSAAKKSSPRTISCRPTVDEVKQWSSSFESLLSHRYGLAAFHIFSKSEFCEENIEFWIACEEFQRIKSPAKLASRARSIYEKFIKSESPKEINVDCHTKETIAQSLQAPTLCCFTKAQNKVFSLMENNSYPRFKESELYKELCALARRSG